jgi:hypothetical protein
MGQSARQRLVGLRSWDSLTGSELSSDRRQELVYRQDMFLTVRIPTFQFRSFPGENEVTVL